MKICIFSRSFYPAIGGQERFAAVLAREFSGRGHRVVVLTDTPCAAADENSYVVVRSRHFWKRVAVFRECDKVLFMSSSLQGLAACWLAGRRTYVSHQSLYGIGRGFERMAGWLKAWLSRFTVNVCISEFQRRRLPAPSVLIPNPVDQEFTEQRTRPLSRFDFGFAGRLVADKGVGLLLEAFSMVQASHPNVSLRIIGDGPERAALEDQSGRLGLIGRVSFAGSLGGDELVMAMAECRCLVVPSVWEEPFGMSALEGMAVCAHVIVTRRGALPDVVCHFGAVADPDPESLACAMEDFLRAGPASPLGASAKAHYLQEFAPGRIAARYLEVLNGEGVSA